MRIRSIWTAATSLLLIAGIAFAQPKPKSQKEIEALMAIQNAQDPDKRIEAVEHLLTNFADTDYKGFALMIAAASAQQKNDYEKMVVYAERTLEADPKNFQAMLMLANGLATRTREHDLDREEKLGRAEKYAKDALELVKAAQKPNEQVPDAQWEDAKKDLQSQAYEALAQAAFVRKKNDVAAENWKTAIDTAANPDPATMVRLANTYNLMNKPDEAIAVLDKMSTVQEVHPQVKAAADQTRQQAQKIKSGEIKAPAGEEKKAPAQIEIKP